MRTYQCIKKVQASQIQKVDTNFLDEIDIVLEDGEIIHLSKEMTVRYTPVAGDYYVVYDDGYASLSPQKIFEDGYKLDS